MKLRRFTPDEDAAIAALYGSGATLRAIGERLDRQWPSIQQRVRVLQKRGVDLNYGKRARRPWTEADDAELRGCWGWISQEKAALRLGRTVTACHLRAKRLGLSDIWKGAYTATGVAHLFAVDVKTVTCWITNGWLAARKSSVRCGGNRKWRIEHEAVEAFIRDYPMYYGLRRIREPYWRDLAEQACRAFELVPLRVAAARLRVCDETIKRRLRRGLMHGERVPWAGGFAWMVRERDLDSFRYLRPPVAMVYEKGHPGAVQKVTP